MNTSPFNIEYPKHKPMFIPDPLASSTEGSDCHRTCQYKYPFNTPLHIITNPNDFFKYYICVKKCHNIYKPPK